MTQLKLAFDLETPGKKPSPQTAQVGHIFRDAALFTAAFSSIRLRSYQEGAARAITSSVIKRRGLTFVVMFPRQSGKNELQAQIEAYLLAMFQGTQGEIVKISPTWKPQSLNAMRRLERALAGNRLLKDAWRKEQGYIYRVGRMRIYFLSGSATSNVVGATASLLLECDEAQEVSPLKWDKEINPMAASTQRDAGILGDGVDRGDAVGA